MKTICALLAGALALAACTAATTGGPALPESAGAAGPGYCESPPPADAAAAERWNELCLPGPR
jgi:hypothetical protein